ncbi:N-acetylmuramoyl-L-alanine amidase [Lysobacter maris]|uniref:N-acetylmuramoyl-L-alanine amidase n=1 Tax=Marilutibacter maris TaxID=1605891 RepID=A0A508B3C2_9GAMM|nr:N-acetylmuramoyl-L-alanine amidase [Lysobacter maris]KAB8198587.1 N-acetylmuramoyl-L-alanine amidase [Lysobacter maris]
MPAPSIVHAPLPYQDRLQARDTATIDLVVIHCTELPDLAIAREFGERIHYPGSGTGNSGHFYVDRDGSVQQWVDIARIAHHVRGYNARSIGIELVNRGRWPHWHDAAHQAMDEPYGDAQIASLTGLIGQLRMQLPSLQLIAGHEDLDTDEIEARDDPSLLVRRKRDPGPMFPWARVLAALPLRRLPSP